MPLLIRAIITGFGYKLGSELGRYVVDRFGKARAKKSAAADEDEVPDSLLKEPAPAPPIDPPVMN